ncbi:HNH endonuclease signature motif containing protein [Romboutsia lituseburensis]|uniref:HNH endonuclease signature motif containing protein n=1 Tax=Romboutsia lituseburensis TaxID=1537 RepID=UPI0022EA7890|nr:HNH endonuclease signature motif containing protein [Romboutsia lituseburensis]
MSLKKMCARCQKIIDYGNRYCKECQEIEDAKNKQRCRNYNKNKRDKESQAFYNSKDWKSVVEVVKNRDKGLCLHCLFNNKISYYNVVHHIEELNENKDKALDIDNLICLCHSCHAKIHREYKTENKIYIQNKLKAIIKTTF